MFYKFVIIENSINIIIMIRIPNNLVINWRSSISLCLFVTFCSSIVSFGGYSSYLLGMFDCVFELDFESRYFSFNWCNTFSIEFKLSSKLFSFTKTAYSSLLSILSANMFWSKKPCLNKWHSSLISINNDLLPLFFKF